MKLNLFRHATLLLEFGGKKLLVDPMLSEKEAMPPIINSSNDRRNPLVDLTAPVGYLNEIGAVLLTHTHRDHFDDAAAKLLPKKIPVLCQPEDEAKLQGLGFEKVLPVEDATCWEGITLLRTGGQHGTGEIGKMMSPVSGFVLKATDEPTLYIAGDTIYCREVETVLHEQRPNIAVLNGGGARFTSGDPITMTAGDVVKVLDFAPDTRVVVVHLDAINHCLNTRDDFRQLLQQQILAERVLIPADGDTLPF